VQFALGVLVYEEPFAAQQLVGFAFVWAAVIVFGAEGFVARGRQRSEAVAPVR
jgi:chloramphenicol-sensitive protein RarD